MLGPFVPFRALNVITFWARQEGVREGWVRWSWGHGGSPAGRDQGPGGRGHVTGKTGSGGARRKGHEQGGFPLEI